MYYYMFVLLQLLYNIRFKYHSPRLNVTINLFGKFAQRGQHLSLSCLSVSVSVTSQPPASSSNIFFYPRLKLILISLII